LQIILWTQFVIHFVLILLHMLYAPLVPLFLHYGKRVRG
jgi:hypothetical protein